MPLCFVFLTAGVGFAACGGDSTTSETTSADNGTASQGGEISKRRYLERADSICLGLNQRLDGRNRRSRPEQKGKLIIARGIAKLGELPTPDGSEAEIRQLNLAATKGGLAGAAGSGDALIEYPSFNRFGRLAKAYGFTGACTRYYG